MDYLPPTQSKSLNSQCYMFFFPGRADCWRPEWSDSYLGSEDWSQWAADSRTRGLSQLSSHWPRCQLHGSSQQLGQSPHSPKIVLSNDTWSGGIKSVKGLYFCPNALQGNCYVWNLAGGIGEEVTQLIPKTKIPAHKRYSLRCKFSPDSTWVSFSTHFQTFCDLKGL